MQQIKKQSAILLTAIVTAILAGCGGGSGTDLPAKPKFTSQVSFGDSLSDVGSYKVGVVSTVMHGGQFTINIPDTATNWTEQTAKALDLKAPCAAETGLDGGTGPYAAYTVAPQFDATCTSYAQGGARVSAADGIGNANSLVQKGFFLTVPVTTQVSNHLNNTAVAPGNKFTGTELVLVMAGANDVLTHVGLVIGGGETLNTATSAVQAAAHTLATEVKDVIVTNGGAKYVVVANVPDIAGTPHGTDIATAYGATRKDDLDTLVKAFNAQLKADLPDTVNVLNVDAYSASKDEVANPSKYNLTNVADTACDLSQPNPNPMLNPNPLASSLVCYFIPPATTNLATGVSPSAHYLFADKVHPTPYGHALFATYVLQAMVNKGWY